MPAVNKLIIILIVLLGLFFGYNYFTSQNAGAPTKEAAKNFRGPNNLPLIKGPTGPPPTGQPR